MGGQKMGVATLGGLLGRLTPRETEVLGAMAEGRSNAAIAEELFVSGRAVEKHINSIFSKLCLTGNGTRHPRVQAVLMALVETQPQTTPPLTPPALRPSHVVPQVPRPAARHRHGRLRTCSTHPTTVGARHEHVRD
jgi:DNA-binding CsgD family transcriptional regulator